MAKKQQPINNKKESRKADLKTDQDHSSMFQKIAGFSVLFIIALLFLTPLYGITGAAYAMAASSLIAGAYSVFHLHRLVQLSLPKIAETVLSVVIATAAPLLVALLFLRFPLFNTTLGFLFLGGVISLGYLYTMYLTYRFAKKGPYPTLRIIGMSFVDRFKMRFSFLR
jgi:hypothetical protein